MSDIVSRLLACQYDKDNFPNMRSEKKLSVGDALDAAREIERLKAQLDEYREKAWKYDQLCK